MLRRSGVVPAERWLASCSIQGAARLKPMRHTMSFNVEVTNKGRAVLAYVQHSTLGDRETEACMVEVLRKAQWPELPSAAPSASAAPAWKIFLAQPAPVVPVPDAAPTSHVRPKLPVPEPPVGAPGPTGKPYVLTIPLGPLLVGVGIVRHRSEVDAIDDRIDAAEQEPYSAWDILAYEDHQGNALSGVWSVFKYQSFDRKWPEVVRCMEPAYIDALIRWGRANIGPKDARYEHVTIPDDVRAAWRQAWRN